MDDKDNDDKSGRDGNGDNVFSFTDGKREINNNKVTGDSSEEIISPDEVLKHADGKLESILLLGVDKDGMLYLAASHAEMRDLIFLLESAKHTLMNME